MVKSSPPDDVDGEFRYSVVIPAHDGEATIGSAIESALTQTIPPAEVIVIDDGSVDDTSSVVRNIASPLIVLVRQENRGPGAARNRGIEIARSPWVALLDADDCWAKDHAESLRDLSRDFPDAKLLAGSYCELSSGRRRIVAPDRSGECSLAQFLAGPGLSPIHTSAVALRREFVSQIGGFASCFPGEDVDLWFRCLLANRIAMTRRVTSFYVRRARSVMGQADDVTRKLRSQPLLKSLDEAIGDLGHANFRPSLIRYREKIYRMFLRQAVTHSDSTTSRDLVRMMRDRQIPVPFLLAACSAAPHPALLLANTIRHSFSRFGGKQ